MLQFYNFTINLTTMKKYAIPFGALAFCAVCILTPNEQIRTDVFTFLSLACPMIYAIHLDETKPME